MAVLVIADLNGSALDESTNKTVTAALEINSDVDILVAGSGTGGAAAAAAKISGVRKVRHADDAQYEHRLAENFSNLVVSVAGDYDAILKSANTTGKNVLPRVAALLDVMQVSEIVEVVSADTFVRPIYAGNAMETVKSNDAKKVVTVRATAFAAAANDGSASVEAVSPADASDLSAFVNEELTKSDRPELTAAKIVIPVAGRWHHSRILSNIFSLLPIKWAPRWALLVLRLTRVMCPMITKLVRPVKSLPQSFILRWEFPARSSTWLV